MAVIGALCVLLLVMTTVIHYEVLRGLNAGLPFIAIPHRARLVIVIFGAFFAHAVEIFLYALAIYLLIRHAGLGTLGGDSHLSISAALYFSAETYTSLGYGDLVPTGDLRMLSGAEALNGLLLIGWSVSYTYLSMERFWNRGAVVEGCGSSSHKP